MGILIVAAGVYASRRRWRVATSGGSQSVPEWLQGPRSTPCGPICLYPFLANGLLGRVFLGHGFYLLSESRTLS
jgi:hypothetical protein